MTKLKVVLLFITLICACLCFSLIRCRIFACVPDRDFATSELEVPVAYFPADVHHNPLSINRHSPRTSQDGFFTTHYWNGTSGSFIYLVNRYYRFDVAEERFRAESTRFARFPELAVDLLANDAKVNCNTLPVGRCYAAMRYEEFVFYMNADVDPDSFTQQDFISVLEYLDSDMSERLRSQDKD